MKKTIKNTKNTLTATDIFAFLKGEKALNLINVEATAHNAKIEPIPDSITRLQVIDKGNNCIGYYIGEKRAIEWWYSDSYNDIWVNRTLYDSIKKTLKGGQVKEVGGALGYKVTYNDRETAKRDFRKLVNAINNDLA